MKLKAPCGGFVEAAGKEAERLIACGFSPVEPPKPPKKAAPRKRKTTTK